MDRSNSPPLQPSTSETPGQRLAAVWRAATARVGPGEQVQPPPPELKEWAQNTALGTAAGMAWYGTRQWLAHRQTGPVRVSEEGRTPAQVARLVAEENTRRLARTASESIRGAVSVGGLVGLFCALQLGSAIAHGEQRLQDTVWAATTTGAFFGALVPGTAAWRLRSAALGAALGAAVSLPLGALHLRLLHSLQQRKASGAQSVPASSEHTQRREGQEGPGRDVTEAVIQQLQASLRDSPGKLPGGRAS